MTIHYFGGDADILEKLTRLQKDLATLQEGGGPTEEELAEAPVLTQWRLAKRPQICLEGIGIGHPLLGTTTILTSGLYAINVNRGWARTYSRFYRLALPFPHEEGRS
jgi:hypothetical protein